MRARVSLEVERIVEAFPTESAEVALDVAVALDVSVQETLQWKHFAANPTHEPVVLRLHTWGWSIEDIYFTKMYAGHALHKQCILVCRKSLAHNSLYEIQINCSTQRVSKIISSVEVDVVKYNIIILVIQMSNPCPDTIIHSYTRDYSFPYLDTVLLCDPC